MRPSLSISVHGNSGDYNLVGEPRMCTRSMRATGSAVKWADVSTFKINLRGQAMIGERMRRINIFKGKSMI